MSMTVALANQVAGALFSNAPLSVSSPLQVVLLTTLPDQYGAGTQVSGGGYAPVVCDPPDWTVGQNAEGMTEVRNAVAIVFPAPTGDWGTVVGAGLYNGSTALCNITLEQPVTVEEGDNPPVFAIGALTFHFA